MQSHAPVDEQPRPPEYAENFSAAKQPNGKGPGHPVPEERVNKSC